MTRIGQMVPFMGAGSGVAGVAWNLDRELRSLGAEVDSFTFTMARRGQPDPIRTRGRISARFVSSWRVLWFSTTGTRLAKEYLAAHPDTVAIVHSNIMTGDVYVNHG